MKPLRLHNFLPLSKVDGPGERAVLFVQGCPIRCDGCAVPGTWPPEEGTEADPEEIVRRILDGPAVDGVTFLGGEPFEQAEALAFVADEARGAGLSVVTFTGYTLKKIREKNDPAQNKLLSLTDLLIDGPYIKELTDTSRPWVGSMNQQYHFLTEKLKEWEKRLPQIKNKLEVVIKPNGVVYVNGLVARGNLKEFVESLVN